APVFGAIAQLGERYNGIVEVGGSIPPGSTNREAGSICFRPFSLCFRLDRGSLNPGRNRPGSTSRVSSWRRPLMRTSNRLALIGFIVLSGSLFARSVAAQSPSKITDPQDLRAIKVTGWCLGQAQVRLPAFTKMLGANRTEAQTLKTSAPDKDGQRKQE